jgi:CRISPR system Cascade subunit CasB
MENNPILDIQVVKEIPSDLEVVMSRDVYSIPSIKSAIGKLATMLGPNSGLSTGDLAQLRRISPERPFTPALWRLLLSLGIDQSPPWIKQDVWERRWATIMMAMSLTQGLHSSEIRFGEALASSGWSELRFVKLMNSRGEMLEVQIRQLARYLAGKVQAANWAEAADLIFKQEGNYVEQIRLQISRSYYITLFKQQQN